MEDTILSEELKIKMNYFTLDCLKPQELARFYAKMLKWDIMVFDEDFVCVYAPGTGQCGYPGILFQKNPAYVRPVWPEQPGAQQQMAHMDFAVNNLDQAVQFAITCGATISEEQFSDGWRVMLDPAGHPFCLCEMKAAMESPQFGLR